MLDLPPTIDPKTFWRVLGMRACAGAVVTTATSSGRAGFLALSATHLTQDPPTMLVTIGKSTSALSAILESENFAINYLNSEQVQVADMFGGKSDLRGDARFAPDRWTTLKTGAPVLSDAVGVLDCELVEVMERYGAIIAIGAIVGHISSDQQLKPLVYYKGKTI